MKAFDVDAASKGKEVVTASLDPDSMLVLFPEELPPRNMARTKRLKQKTTPVGSTPSISILESHAAKRAAKKVAKKRADSDTSRSSRVKAKV
ncbi:hypothetical protein LWI28_022763 [Acer negundo]|uniref:Uncharacterized protein n=1 Tax=Acer negundo TaxID=4023 RepID=A0AAD5IRV5_ACENE|nr:hypothetical protein LWI28_022763 [Acer negundo]